MTHFVYMNTLKMIGLKRKRHLFEAEKLKSFLLFSGIDIQKIKKIKKAMLSLHSTYIPSSVKSP